MVNFYTFVTFAKSEAFRAYINSHPYFASQSHTVEWCDKTYNLVSGKYGFPIISDARLILAGITAQQRTKIIARFEVTIELDQPIIEEEEL